MIECNNGTTQTQEQKRTHQAGTTARSDGQPILTGHPLTDYWNNVAAATARVAATRQQPGDLQPGEILADNIVPADADSPEQPRPPHQAEPLALGDWVSFATVIRHPSEDPLDLPVQLCRGIVVSFDDSVAMVQFDYLSSGGEVKSVIRRVKRTRLYHDAAEACDSARRACLAIQSERDKLSARVASGEFFDN